MRDLKRVYRGLVLNLFPLQARAILSQPRRCEFEARTAVDENFAAAQELRCLAESVAETAVIRDYTRRPAHLPGTENAVERRICRTLGSTFLTWPIPLASAAHPYSRTISDG